MTFVLPKHDKRTAIIGSTGSGKTQLAAWLLSSRDFYSRPWFIIDFKGEKLIADIGAREISVYVIPPKEPGLYVIRPVVGRDDAALETFLWRVWEQEEAGLYTDEGFMLGNRNPAVNALLTQGRSKHIEMITLIQRPVWCSKFIFSEANHFYIMRLTLEDDRKYVASYLDGTEIGRLPKFHSYWYNVDEQEGLFLRPVPSRAEILATFRKRMESERRVYAL